MADGAQISTSVSIINSLLGFNALSLTNFTTSAVSSIAAGSKIEIVSAFFDFPTDCLPNASSWTAISTGSTAYLQLTPSGTSGSQIVSASWSSSAPVWSTSKQGWYASTASTIRVVASAYKSGPTSQEEKKILLISQDTNNRAYFNNITTVGTIILQLDSTYLLSATCSSIILPASPIAGQKITFKNKGNYTNTITANTGQTIGTTTSTSFVLYAQEDYVTLEYDGISIWYVIATNGPILSANQSASLGSLNGTGAWTAVGNGLVLALGPGVYDIEWAIYSAGGGGFAGAAIGNALTPIGPGMNFAGGSLVNSSLISVKGYVLTAAANIQALYISSGISGSIQIGGTTATTPKISARRIG